MSVDLSMERAALEREIGFGMSERERKEHTAFV